MRVEKLTECGPKVSAEANLLIGSCWFDPLLALVLDLAKSQLAGGILSSLTCPCFHKGFAGPTVTKKVPKKHSKKKINSKNYSKKEMYFLEFSKKFQVQES